VLIVKAVLVAVAAGLAVAGRVWLHQRPRPGIGPARATRLECGMIAAVLAVVGLLTALTPPATPVRPAAAVRLHQVGADPRAHGAAGVRSPSGPGRA
jgi:hypothetical protein